MTKWGKANVSKQLQKKWILLRPKNKWQDYISIRLMTALMKRMFSGICSHRNAVSPPLLAVVSSYYCKTVRCHRQNCFLKNLLAMMGTFAYKNPCIFCSVSILHRGNILTGYISSFESLQPGLVWQLDARSIFLSLTPFGSFGRMGNILGLNIDMGIDQNLMEYTKFASFGRHMMGYFELHFLTWKTWIWL